MQITGAIGGAGAVWTAPAKSLTVWLTQRRSDLTIEVTSPTVAASR